MLSAIKYILTTLQRSNPQVDWHPDLLQTLQQQLETSETKITHFPRVLLSLSALESLNMSFLRIAAIPQELPTALKHLKYIQAQGTWIEHIPPKIAVVKQLHMQIGKDLRF